MTRLLVLALAVLVGGCDSATRTHMQAAESLMKANEELQKTALEYQTVCMELRTVMQSRIDRLAADSARCAEEWTTVQRGATMRFVVKTDSLFRSSDTVVFSVGSQCYPITMVKYDKFGEPTPYTFYGHNHDSCTQSQEGRR